VFASYGTGFRSWGNRNASFPASTLPTNFISIRRVADTIEESIEYFTLQYLDAPISNAWIDSVLQSVNAFFRTLIGSGAVVDGKAWWDASLNPATQLAAGHVVFAYSFMPPPPAERVTYKSMVDINYLTSLMSGSQS